MRCSRSRSPSVRLTRAHVLLWVYNGTCLPTSSPGPARASPQDSGGDHMNLPEYITKAEVQSVCAELGIRDWTTLATPEVTLDEARRIQAEVGGETAGLTPE